jgi:hypothetical protein
VLRAHVTAEGHLTYDARNGRGRDCRRGGRYLG